ncbi:hypothetical protein SAMN02983003_2572 [Devosia enhydra]|uniref:Oxidoreductase molybdopterin-binding domain-containing protein n=1 Tax=Devosia enhydra TaxID=665118 RepID=A0A1K2HZ96_9HYPH|nr:hypothetical protein [Devosia enhydra]SFZ85408.1 hypothetical protein SAMN02983003_2572 [Devosia enhydra]
MKLTILAAFLLLGSGLGALSSPLTLSLSSEATGALTEFALKDLDALTQSEIKTSTPWTEEPYTFSGPRLSAVIAQAGVSSFSSITLRALNDYSVTLRAQDVAAFEPIVSTRMNGAPMAVEDKGPYWLIFDLDNTPQSHQIQTTSWMIWQLIEVRVR